MKTDFSRHPTISALWVSPEGKVKGPQGLLKTYTLNGYKTLSYKGKSYFVHRLVAQTFIPNPDGKEQVDHINGVRDDNHVENLRWCTRIENNNFPLCLERMSERSKRNATTVLARRKVNNKYNAERSVCQLDMEGFLIRVHKSISEAARFLGDISYNSRIARLLKRPQGLRGDRPRYAYGYRWCYYYECNLGIISLLL